MILSVELRTLVESRSLAGWAGTRSVIKLYLSRLRDATGVTGQETCRSTIYPWHGSTTPEVRVRLVELPSPVLGNLDAPWKLIGLL